MQVLLNNGLDRPILNEKQGEVISSKLRKKMMPINPLFTREALDADDPILKQLVAKSKENLSPETQRTLELAIVRRRLLKRLHKLKELKLTPREVIIYEK